MSLNKFFNHFLSRLGPGLLYAAAIMLSFDTPGHHQSATVLFSFPDTAYLIFLAAFLGWMPAPLASRLNCCFRNVNLSY